MTCPYPLEGCGGYRLCVQLSRQGWSNCCPRLRSCGGYERAEWREGRRRDGKVGGLERSGVDCEALFRHLDIFLDESIEIRVSRTLNLAGRKSVFDEVNGSAKSYFVQASSRERSREVRIIVPIP